MDDSSQVCSGSVSAFRLHRTKLAPPRSHHEERSEPPFGCSRLMSIVGLWAQERVEALGDSDAPEPLLQLIARPGRIACLSARSICIWRTFPRSLLARCQPGTSSQDPADDAHYRMAWHPDGTRLAAISRGTRIYLYAVASPELRRRELQQSHGSPMPLRPSVQQSLAAHCAGSLTCVSADATAVLIGMGGPNLGKGNPGRGSSGSIPASWALVSWTGELLRVLRCAGPAAPLVAMTPALALGTPSAPPSPPPVAAPAPPPAIAPPPTLSALLSPPCSSSTPMATRAQYGASQPAQYGASSAFRPGRPVRSGAAAPPSSASPITEPSTPLVQRSAVTAACAAAVDVHEPRRGEHLHAAALDGFGSARGPPHFGQGWSRGCGSGWSLSIGG